MEALWNIYLYQPVFNLLVWIYNTLTPGSFGWAVVILTVFLRILLLPFTILTEKDKIRNMELIEDVKKLHHGYQNDPVLKKEEIRKALKKRNVRPWAKALVLGVQLLVLVLLYQVFLHGISGEKIFEILYSIVDFPGVINTNFYGFELGAPRDILWSGAVGIFLLAEIYIDYRKHKLRLTQADLLYFILFPLSVFFLLWILPMVKSLFILTSMLFSVVVHRLMRIVYKPARATLEVVKSLKP